MTPRQQAWVAFGPLRGPAMACLLALASVGPMPAEAGWAIDWAGPDGVVRQRDLLQANRLRLTWLGPGGAPVVALVVDLDAQRFSQVYYDKRYYVSHAAGDYAMTIRAVGKMARGAWPASPELLEALRRASPAERAKMEAELRAHEQRSRASGWAQPEPSPQRCLGPRVEGRRTGNQATIGGHAAVRYEVLADGQASPLLAEVWIAPGIAAAPELDPTKVQRFLDAIAGASPPCGPGGEPVEALLASPVWRLLREGYPVRIVGRGGERVDAVRVERRAIAPAELEPPAGFAQRTFAEHIGQ